VEKRFKLLEDCAADVSTALVEHGVSDEDFEKSLQDFCVKARQQRHFFRHVIFPSQEP